MRPSPSRAPPTVIASGTEVHVARGIRPEVRILVMIWMHIRAPKNEIGSEEDGGAIIRPDDRMDVFAR